MTLFNAWPITERTGLFFCLKTMPLDEAFRFGGWPGDMDWMPQFISLRRGLFIWGGEISA